MRGKRATDFPHISSALSLNFPGLIETGLASTSPRERACRAGSFPGPTMPLARAESFALSYVKAMSTTLVRPPIPRLTARALSVSRASLDLRQGISM